MTTRLTPEQEAAINGFLRSGEYMAAPLATVRAAYGVHVGTLLAEMDTLRDELAAVKAGLVWSDEAPTEKGRYWAKEGVFPVTIVDVYEDAGGRMRAMWASGHSSLVSDVLNCQWAGPIAPPQEP